MTLLLSFPSEAPYRIDQVTSNPEAMLALAIGQLAAGGLHGVVVGSPLVSVVWWHSARCSSPWPTGAPATSPASATTWRLTPGEVLDEPLWIAAAPLISALPYRLASLHGLVAGGYALVPLMLSRATQRPQWGGLWALLVLWSPLLRNFLQNGVTRQALATVLITPLLLRVAGWCQIGWGWVAAAVAGSALAHNSFPITTTLALVPVLLTRPGLLQNTGRRTITLASLLVLVSIGIALSQPAVIEKLSNYLFEASYFNTYGLRKAVFGLELSALVAVALTIWRAG